MVCQGSWGMWIWKTKAGTKLDEFSWFSSNNLNTTYSSTTLQKRTNTTQHTQTRWRENTVDTSSQKYGNVFHTSTQPPTRQDISTSTRSSTHHQTSVHSQQLLHPLQLTISVWNPQTVVEGDGGQNIDIFFQPKKGIQKITVRNQGGCALQPTAKRNAHEHTSTVCYSLLNFTNIDVHLSIQTNKPDKVTILSCSTSSKTLRYQIFCENILIHRERENMWKILSIEFLKSRSPLLARNIS